MLLMTMKTGLGCTICAKDLGASNVKNKDLTLEIKTQ